MNSNNFIDNYAVNGGSLSMELIDSININDVKFNNNHGSNKGGAILL